MKRILSAVMLVFSTVSFGQHLTPHKSDSVFFETISSTSFEDFGATLYSGKLLFVSSRETNLFSKKFEYNNQKYFDLFLYDLKEQKTFPFILERQSLNVRYHYGPSFLKSDSSGIFISRNFDQPDKKGNVNFYLAYHSFENGTTDTLPFCSQEYSTQHPCFDEENQRLYFSSNRPGGNGGYDIYYSDYTQDDGWSIPVNLEEVNTIRNEVFPTITDRGISFSKNTDAGDLDLFEIDFLNDSSIVSNDDFNSRGDDFQLVALNGDSSVFSRSHPGKFDSDIILTYHKASAEKSPDVYYSHIIPINPEQSIADQADSLYLLYDLKFDSYVTANEHIGFDVGLNALNDSSYKNLLDLSYKRVTSADSIPWQPKLIERKNDLQVDLSRQYGKGRFSSIVYKDSSLVNALQVLNEALQIDSRSFLYNDGKNVFVSGPKRPTSLQARMDSLNFKNSGLTPTIIESADLLPQVPIDKLLSIECIDADTKEKLNFDIRYYDYESQENIYSESISSSENLLVAYLEDRVLGSTILSEGYLPVSIKIEKTSVPANDIKVVVAEMTKIIRGVEQSFTLKNIHFDFDDYTLTATAIKELELVLPVLKQFESIKIIGHTDSKGSSSYNQRLSENRSNATKNYLSSRGIPNGTMQAVGRGEEVPVDTNETDEGRANNRRAEFIVK